MIDGANHILSTYFQQDPTFADKACELSLAYYTKLPSKGKPANHEWTILACFILYDSDTKGIAAISKQGSVEGDEENT
jgi:hypothetical protein